MKIEKLDRQATIVGKRISLRPLERDDATLVARFANDERIAQMTSSIPFPLPFDAAEAFVAAATADDRSKDVWAIDGSQSGEERLLGVISLEYLDRDQSEVNYWVAPEFWNRGYASEALGTLLNGNPHNNTSMVACVFQDNPGSARVLSVNGFSCLGEAEAFSLSRAAHVPTWTYLKSF